MVYRCIAPDWLKLDKPTIPKVLEGELSEERIQELNKGGYNIFFLPNYPSIYNKGTTVDGSMIDTFRFVFVDFDLKSGAYPSKEAFQTELMMTGTLKPTFVVDSGNGVHAYWEVTDLDAMSFLRLSRRLMRKFNTDPAVQKIYQLMRVPGTVNTKIKDAPKDCTLLFNSENKYSCEQLASLLPPISPEDEEYCQQHWNKTFAPKENIKVDDQIPTKFRKLLKDNKEVQKIWKGDVADRSIADYRLGHLLLANGFTKEEAMSVLVNTGKAATRAPGHRINYAQGIVDKVWDYEDSCQTPPPGSEEDIEAFDPEDLSQSVQDILDGDKRAHEGEQIQCYSWIDNTKTGFCLGHVIGLVAGVKVGKTILGLNMTKGFVSFQPDMDHIFVALEQPAYEIAGIWKKLCAEEPRLWPKLRVISNYNKDGSHRQLSLEDIENYVVAYQKKTGRKVGSVQIDHIGALKLDGYDRFKPLEDACKRMKPFAIRTNTLLIMQSHAPREKAGQGDLELNQDAAYGTQRYEAFVDWLVTMWQPLKRMYGNKACPKVTAFKFAAMRHKDDADVIQENERYRATFVPATGSLREMTQNEETQFDYFNKLCINKRKQDKKTEVLSYTSVKNHAQTKADPSKDSPAA